MTILFVDTWYSSCGKCGGNADPHEKTHVMEHMEGEGCGATFTSVTSHYFDFEGLYDRIRAMRPDLPFKPAWEVSSDVDA